MTTYQIKHRKTGHTQVITEAQLNILRQKGWSRQYEIEALQSQKTNFYPPEIKQRPDDGRKNQKSTKRIS